MFVKIDNNKENQIFCKIAGIGHSREEDSDKFRIVSQKEFIEYLPESVQQEICKNGQSIDEVAEKWGEQISVNRTFFDGSVVDLGMLAVSRCFENAMEKVPYDCDPFATGTFDPFVIDAIIGATNTGPGYPSLADHIKKEIGISSKTACFDVVEACTAGSVAIFNARNMIASGACKTVLVVCSEKATTLAPLADWQGSNLFGDASFAILLQATDNKNEEAFSFFYANSYPFDGNLEFIKKTDNGFMQNGRKVHQFVVGKVVEEIVSSVKRAGIKVRDVKHFVPHQPSNKTNSSLVARLAGAWQDQLAKEPPTEDLNLEVTFHKSEGIGNASSASFGHLLSQLCCEGKIKSGELVITCTFGSGLSLAISGFKFT